MVMMMYDVDDTSDDDGDIDDDDGDDDAVDDYDGIKFLIKAQLIQRQ